MDFIKKTVQLKRVVVTGLGIIAPVGNNMGECWENLKAGKSGIQRITRFDASEYYSQIAGEVKNYDPFDHFDRKLPSRYRAS